MRSIDHFSYELGAADCFCEMVRAGVKGLALAHILAKKGEPAVFRGCFPGVWTELCPDTAVFQEKQRKTQDTQSRRPIPRGAEEGRGRFLPGGPFHSLRMRA